MSAASEVIRSIERVAGRAAPTLDAPGGHRFGGAEPEFTVAPENEDQLVEIVRACSGGEVVLAPIGAALQEFDIRPHGDTRPVVLVSTQNLRRVHHYSSEDLTLTVGAGLTLGALDDLVRPNGQHLPFDPPFRRAATLGGAIACNAVGPRGLSHGLPQAGEAEQRRPGSPSRRRFSLPQPLGRRLAIRFTKYRIKGPFVATEIVSQPAEVSPPLSIRPG